MPIAMRIPAPGGPDALGAEDVAVPPPGPDEVQVAQTVIGVNFVDIYFRTGLYPLPPGPTALGFEGAGRVTAIGAEVTDFHPGDRVAYAGMPLGAYAELRNLPQHRLVKLPDSIPDRVAGSAMLRGLTAHMLLHKVHAVKPGDWILVHAAAGGLGQIVTRWAKRLGANVIGTAGSEAKIKLALSAGADEALIHGDPDWVRAARRLADGKGVHLAIDGIGGGMLAQTLGCVRPFGIVASLGQPAGPIPPVPVEDLGFARSIALMRPSFIAYSNDARLYRESTQSLLAALDDWLVSPPGSEYPLRDAARAHADLEAGRTAGSVALLT